VIVYSTSRLSPELFHALDQFEVEKLGREVRRGQTENTKQGYRNGGRAPYGYRLRHEPHPDPARARAGDQKSRLVADPEQAPVIAEMFALFLAGSGYKEIADHLNRPGGPPPPRHVDSKRNTAGKWSRQVAVRPRGQPADPDRRLLRDARLRPRSPRLPPQAELHPGGGTGAVRKEALSAAAEGLSEDQFAEGRTGARAKAGSGGEPERP
jgi:hypothetical protein